MQTISRIAIIFLSMFILVNSFAQKKDFNNESAFKLSSGHFDKSPSSFNNFSNAGNDGNNVNKKIARHFKKIYNASNVKWYQLDDNRFLAKFSSGETSSAVLFDRKGDIIYSINFCFEKQVPDKIKTLVLKKYDGYIITSAAKLLQDDREIWVVKLAGKSDYIAATVEDGEIEEIENFKKAM